MNDNKKSEQIILSTDNTTILKYEHELIEAYKTTDIETISKLYHDRLVFNSPDGQLLTKKDDIEALKSKVLVIHEYEASNYEINFIDNDVATVSVKIHIKGKVNNNAFGGTFRFLRVWKRINTEWKLIAISGIPIEKI